MRLFGWQNFEGGLGWVGAPSACISIVFMAHKAFIRNENGENPVTYFSIYEDYKEKVIIVAKLVDWGEGTR